MIDFSYRSSKAQLGFTLVELLVGLSLGLFIITVSLTYLVSSGRTFSSQTNDDVIQENARFALELLTQQFRLAGLDPSAGVDDQLEVILTSRFCANNNSSVAEGGINDSGNADGACTKDSSGGAFASDRFGFDYKVVAPTTTCGGQVITQTMLNNSDGTISLASVFWIQDNPDRVGVRSLYCQTFDLENNQTIGPGVPLIDGIDAMQVQYGRDSNDDGLVDSYVNYTDLTNGVANASVATRNVSLVKLAMLISSGLSSTSNSAITGAVETQEDTVYNLLDAASFTVSDERVLRQIFSTTILIPNALGE